MRTRTIIIAALLLLVAATGGCRKEPVSNSNQAKQLSDNSTLEVNTALDGSKTEARVFEGGDVARASRITRPNADPFVLVELRDGRNAVIRNPDEVRGVMDASEEAIAMQARTAIEALGTAPQTTSVTPTTNANRPGTGKKKER